MNSHTKPHFGHSALITIDTQNDFTLPGASAEIPGTTAVLPNMAHLLETCRGLNLPVIHIVRLYLPDGSNADICRRKAIEEGKQIVFPDSRGAELVREIRPPEAKPDAELLLGRGVQEISHSEWMIYKPRWGAFYQTPLEQHLKKLKISTLIFCGCNYPNCPRTSIYEASERDFRIVLVRDAVSQLYPRGEEEMKNIGVCLMTTQEVVGRISSANDG